MEQDEVRLIVYDSTSVGHATAAVSARSIRNTAPVPVALPPLA